MALAKRVKQGGSYFEEIEALNKLLTEATKVGIDTTKITAVTEPVEP